LGQGATCSSSCLECIRSAEKGRRERIKILLEKTEEGRSIRTLSAQLKAVYATPACAAALWHSEESEVLLTLPSGREAGRTWRTKVHIGAEESQVPLQTLSGVEEVFLHSETERRGTRESVYS